MLGGIIVLVRSRQCARQFACNDEFELPFSQIPKDVRAAPNMLRTGKKLRRYQDRGRRR